MTMTNPSINILSYRMQWITRVSLHKHQTCLFHCFSLASAPPILSSPNCPQRPVAGSKVAAENSLLYKRSCDVSLQALQNLCLFLSCLLSAVGLSVLFNGPRSTVCAGCTGPFYLPPTHWLRFGVQTSQSAFEGKGERRLGYHHRGGC